MLYAPGTFTGNYIPQGDLLDAELVSVHEFGVGVDGAPGQANLALVEFVLEEVLDKRPDLQIVGTQAVARALQEVSARSDYELSVHHRVTGESSDVLGGGVGTWGELQAARQVMEAQGLSRLLVVGQAYHVPRIGRQAIKMAVPEIILPPNLPRSFAPDSVQPWTRNPLAWAAREAVGAWWLQRQGKL